MNFRKLNEADRPNLDSCIKRRQLSSASHEDSPALQCRRSSDEVGRNVKRINMPVSDDDDDDDDDQDEQEYVPPYNSYNLLLERSRNESLKGEIDSFLNGSGEYSQLEMDYFSVRNMYDSNLSDICIIFLQIECDFPDDHARISAALEITSEKLLKLFLEERSSLEEINQAFIRRASAT